jgi:hypothetical protein
VESCKHTVESAAPAADAHHRNAFRFGFTPQAELWNGRLAMLGFVICLLWNIVIKATG